MKLNFDFYGLTFVLIFRHAIANERQAMIDCCRQWTKAVGPNRPFMGGNSPDLADLVGVVAEFRWLDGYFFVEYANFSFRIWLSFFPVPVPIFRIAKILVPVSDIPDS